MATYKMHLENEHFELIKSGNKKVDARLLDSKRSAIRTGDLIEYSNRSNDDKIVCKVNGIYKFPTFKELYSLTDKRLMGYIDGQEYNYHDMEEYYSTTDQETYGVIAIYVELLR